MKIKEVWVGGLETATHFGPAPFRKGGWAETTSFYAAVECVIENACK